jgi:hypothetical protein
MKSILAIASLLPLLTTSLPTEPTTNTTLDSRDTSRCEIVFNTFPCADSNKDKFTRFTPSIFTDRPDYRPHPSLPQTISSVSHCFDFPHFADQSLSSIDIKYDAYGRSIITDRVAENISPFRAQAHMWLLEDTCKFNYQAVAVFEKEGCQGAYFWYDIGAIAELGVQGKQAEQPAISWAQKGDKSDWCVAPFWGLPAVNTVGSFQMWTRKPGDGYMGLGLGG